MSLKHNHTFSFFRAGGFDQVRFESADDLVNLEKLDLKLWLALACPVKGLALDALTLCMIDSDKDGRIRVPELIAALKWTTSLLKDPALLLSSPKELPLSEINETTDEGKMILEAAKTILLSLKKESAVAISVSDTTDATHAFNAMPFNGDGVITELSAQDEASKQLILEIVDCVGSVEDRSGKIGVNADLAAAFFKHVKEYVEWLTTGESDNATMPVGERTEAAFAAFLNVRIKVDDYFMRCRLAAFDERAAAALNRNQEDYVAVAGKNLSMTSEEIRAFPLAKIAADKALSLTDGLNPAWADAVLAFDRVVVKPLLKDKTALTEAEWNDIKKLLTPHEAWLAAKVGTQVEKLGRKRLTALAADNSPTSIHALLEEEKKRETTAKSLAEVEKLVHFSRDLFRLLNNFVSFRDFYQQKIPAIFQFGTLFLDQRECRLCIRVEDAAKHSAMANLSRVHLAYCDCTRSLTGEKMTIAAAFTAGDSDNLTVGRNGVFFDNDGKDWDATITKIVDNPISVRQAFWAPYKKLVRFIEDQVAKRAGASAAKSEENLLGGAEKVASAADTGQVAPAPKKLDIGIVAAIGVAVGGLTAALGALLQAFFGLGIWMPLGVLGLLILISGPSMLIARLKLRQRNIGPLLDANGWAMNSNALLNVPLGTSLTVIAAIPKGARVDKTDIFREKRRPWKLYFVLLLVLGFSGGWYLGKLDRFLPLAAQSRSVFGNFAPAVEKEIPSPSTTPPPSK
jgi:hypothetical protein